MFGPTETMASLTDAFYSQSQMEGKTLAEFIRATMLMHDRMEQRAEGPELSALRLLRDKALKERLVQGA